MSKKNIIKILLAPVEHCWEVTEAISPSWPYPKAMRVLVTAFSTLLACALGAFLIVALIRGIVSFF